MNEISLKIIRMFEKEGLTGGEAVAIITNILLGIFLTTEMKVEDVKKYTASVVQSYKLNLKPKKEVEFVDKLIRSIEKKVEKDAKKEKKSLKSLEKADKKRDKTCEYGARMMKAKKKK